MVSGQGGCKIDVNYPVLRQNKRVILKNVRKTPWSKDTTLYINTGSKKGFICS